MTARDDLREHGPSWPDYVPGDRPSCHCGYNGTPAECRAARPAPAVAEGTDVEVRMFTAEDVRDVLADLTNLDYGTRNRIAWAIVDRLAQRPTRSEP